MAAQLNLVTASSAGNTYDLTALGSADWFVYPSSTTQVKKNVASLLSYAAISGTNGPAQFSGTTSTLSWSDGTPTASGSSNGGMYLADAQQDKGFTITAPAGAGVRTLRVFIGAYQTTAKVVTTLSDGSAATVTDTSTVYPGSGDAFMKVVTIDYAAGSEGQTLTVTVTNNTTVGNIDLQGAALTTAAGGGGGAVAPAAPTSVTATASGGTVSVTATPGANGGAAITAYNVIVYAVDDNAVLGTGSAASFPVVVSGVLPEAVYAKVSATNSVGTSPLSAASNQVTPTAGSGQVQVAISDANLFWSPYTWDDYGTHKSANATGAYLKTTFSGTSVAVKVDVSAMVAAGISAGQYPIVKMIIDGYKSTDTTLTSATTSVSVTGLADTTHTLEFHFIASQNGVDRWNGPTGAIRVTGLTLDTGKSVSAYAARPKRLIYFGDSITEGYLSLGTTTNAPAGNSSLHTAVPIIAQALNCEYGQVGFGGQGYIAPGQGNVPELYGACSLYSAGRSRLVGGVLSPAPDYVMVEHGANGYADLTQAQVQASLTKLRSIAPSAKIIIRVPAGGFARAAITAAVTAQADANMFLTDLGSRYEAGINTVGGSNMWSLDAIHRNALSNAFVAAGYLAKDHAIIDGAAGPTLTQRTVSITLKTDATTLASNLTGLKCAFYDENSPDLTTTARYQSSTASTNASGVLTFTCGTTRAPGDGGTLVVEGGNALQYSGAATVS